MKKFFLLVGCLAVLSSCNNKKAETTTTTEAATEVAEAVENVAEVAKKVFAEADRIGAKSFGLRQNEAGKWELNLKDLDSTNTAVGELKKIEIADDAEIINLQEVLNLAGLNDETKSVLNNKMVGYWLQDGKISHIVVTE